MKDIMEEYPEPKPATTTIATLLKKNAKQRFDRIQNVRKF